MMNDILAYYQAIQDGSVVVGKWVRLFYKYIVTGLEHGDFFFNQKRAARAIKFIENFCRHHEGVLAPQLIKLELWQKALLSVIFGVVDETGNRQFREVFVVMGRKNGKTLLAAAISAYMAFMDGEYGARIYFAAPKLEQANLCYDAFFQMVQKEPELAALAKKRRSDIYLPDSNTTAKPLAFSAKKSDGLNVSTAILDETASWQGDAGLKFYEVIKSSCGSRKAPLIVSISTAGYQNDGVYDELVKRATAVLMGTSKEKRLCPIMYTIDDVGLWNDINELRKANPNLGVSVSIDYMLEEIAVAESSLSRKNEFLCKYCNVKSSSSTAWLEFQTVQKCVGDAIDPARFMHHYCVGGVDLSQSTDLTSACVVIENKGQLYVLQHFWMPQARVDTGTEDDNVPYRQMIQKGFLSVSGDNYVDYNDVFMWFRNLVEKYEILPLQVGYDKWCATYFVEQMRQYGFHMDDVRQGSNLTPVIREVSGLLKDGVVHIGNNTLTQAHFLNSALKTEEDKVWLVKITKRARIDGMAAFLDAMTVRQKHYANIGAQLQNEGK